MNFIPTDEQWEKMKKFIKGDNYKKENFFVFETLAVGDKIVPNRYIKIMPELLMTMKEDAEKGVSLMLNHNWSQLGVQSIPIGKVFDARIGGPSQDGETTTLYTTQYILRDDSKVDGYSKNDIIKLIESGTLSDTSIGWGTTSESYICSICGNSIYDYRNCEHIPGKKYIVNEDTNEVKQCIIEAHSPKEKHAGNNVLMENSIVFDGAYPNAIIQSAIGNKIETSNGILKILDGKEKLNKKDLIFGFSTPGSINLMYKQSEEKGGIEEMENEQLENENVDTEVVENSEENNTETIVEDTEEVVVEEATTENNDVETTEESSEEVAEESTETTSEENNVTTQSNEVENKMSVEDVLNKFGNISTNLDELIVLAKEGFENRQNVISESLKSGIHAMGNAFNKEIFEKTFSNMQTKDIKEMGETWEKQANEMFKKEKVSKQDFSKDTNEATIKVDYNEYKTSNY